MDKRPSWRDIFHEDTDHFSAADQSRTNYEETAVKYVMKHLYGDDALAAMRAELKSRLGGGGILTFDLLHELHNVAIQFAAARLYHLNELTLHNLFTRPTKLSPHQQWVQLDSERAGRSVPLAMIFSWVDHKRFMVLHTFAYPLYAEGRQFCYSAGRDGKAFTMEPLSQLLGYLRR